MTYCRLLFYTLCATFLWLPAAALGQPATTADTGTTDLHPSDVKLRLMMVDAMMELNSAMLEGVKASIDTLNLPENDNKNIVNEKDIQGTLLRMKRNRDRALLMPYLEHLKDSIGQEISLLENEKTMLENFLAGKDGGGIRTVDTVSTANVRTKARKVKNRDKDDMIMAAEPLTAAPAQKQGKKKNRKAHVTAPMDTVIIYDMPTSPAVKEKSIPGRTAAMDTAALGKAVRDTTTAIKIKLPNSNDSMVIKPVKGKSKPIATGNKKQEDIIAVAGVDSTKQAKASPYLFKAKELAAKQEYKAAEAQIEKALQQYPDYYEAWLLLADINAQTGAITKAANNYKHSIDLDSSQWKPYFLLGNVYIKTNRQYEALAAYNHALRLNPQGIEALMARASVFAALADHKGAIADYDSVISISKTYFKAYRERGNVHLTLQQYKDAGDDFTRYLIFNPDDGEAYYYRGLSRIGTNEIADACLDFNTALQLGFALAENAIKKSCTD